MNVKCEEGLKNLTDSVNTLTEAILNEVRQERVSTVSMVEDFKTKNRNMFIDFKRLSDEKSDEISQELKTSFKYSLSGSGQNSIIPVVCNVPE